jgi:hypothetical protein
MRDAATSTVLARFSEVQTALYHTLSIFILCQELHFAIRNLPLNHHLSPKLICLCSTQQWKT